MKTYLGRMFFSGRMKLNNAIKRLFDLFVSCIMIVFLIPLWIIIPVLIRIDSEGPAYFKQDRLTKNGRIFHMYKFRTMVNNAEKKGSGLFNYENDARVTKIGKVLRTTSIDELPQLFNIFKGDMSFVGPRPCVTYELGEYATLNKRYKKRFSVKAGLTGLAQVKGRNNISWDEKVNYDNLYIDEFKKYGVIVDFKILIETFFSVFKKENIYENKINDNVSDTESAKIAEEEIIRIAHLPDEYDNK